MSENYGGTKNCIDWLARLLELTMLNKIDDTYYVLVKNVSMIHIVLDQAHGTEPYCPFAFVVASVMSMGSLPM